jgi:tetratricopeptide (TPR) repeat protein
MIPNDPGFDPVQAAYNITRKNPAIDWEIEMLEHLKSGDMAQAKRCGVKAASINIELAGAPEADARAATEHLVKAASLLEHVEEYAKALETYERAQERDPAPMTRIIEGRRSTSPLRHFRLARMAKREADGKAALTSAGEKAKARLASAEREGRWREALDDSRFLAEVAAELGEPAEAAKWWARAAKAGAKAGRQARESSDAKDGDPYELSRAAFEEALTCALLSGDDALTVETFDAMARSFAQSARALGPQDEKWAAFRPMEWLIEAGVLLTVAGDFKAAAEALGAARPMVDAFWSEQRGPTFRRMMAHLCLLSGDRPAAEEWRSKYRAEFERKERFDPEVVRPIQLEFDEEFYRMARDEPAYERTLIDVCRNLEPGMREVFEGVDKLLEGGLYKDARRPLDDLAIEAKDQRIWRLLSAFVDWKTRPAAADGSPAAFEDHMWKAIHPFTVPRGGLTWGGVLDVLGAEEDPIDLYPLERTLATVRAARERALAPR